MNAIAKRIVIIGGVACGPKAAARARRRDPDAEIVLIEKGTYLSYAGCGLPYFVGGSVAEIIDLRKTTFDVIRDEEYFQSVKNIDIRTRTLAQEIDRNNKVVKVQRLNGGSVEDIPYDKLVLATGSTPALPPIDGIQMPGVHTLQTPEDAVKIRKIVEAGEADHAVIIGAGLIGLEMVESLFNHAVDATVLELAGTVLPSFLDPEMALMLERDIVRDGVEILTNQQVIRIEGEGKVSKVITGDREISTDMVIVAAGVRPNVALAKAAGLAIGETGALSVNRQMQTSDPDIYAGGDCVECHDLVSGKKIYAPLGSTANKHGRIIGNNVTGDCDEFDGIVGTMILKVLNLAIAKTGLTENNARQQGFDVITSLTPCLDHVHFYPGNKSFIIKLIADKNEGKLLGAQIIGPGDVAKRIDVLATAIQLGASLKQAANLDLSYSPPFSHALDCVIHSANNTRNRIDGLAVASAVQEINDNPGGEIYLILDVRESAETEKTSLPQKNVMNIPLTQLRSRVCELPQNTRIVCCCTQGVRAYEASLILREHGYQKVTFLDGGLRFL